ncbi:MAG: Gfo/Idh/MocA family oxidoreductase [Actinobacteria bacterium]|nr:Gfo/Idh/MocA family oxidoreductase [Actinomycetota bacterium]
MRVVVVGAGAVGARAARQLHNPATVSDLVISDIDERRSASVAASLSEPARSARWSEDLFDGARVVVLAAPPGDHRDLAEAALERGADVVSVSDDAGDSSRLLDLDAEARERGRRVVVGAGFSPGLTCVLARHAASDLSAVDEVHVAKAGTGGPACARQHHRALAGEAVDWRDGAWVRRAAGSGRELCWFPDPVGGLDCYRAALPDARLLRPAFPGVSRITARVSASRRDRVTSRLPMLRPPHPDGVIGAVRVEVRGRRGAATDARVLGALDRPAVAAGAVAAVAAIWAAEGRLAGPGAGGLAVLVADPVPFLHDLAERGIRAAVFEGNAAR